ncbi:hypothetical protein ACOZ4I_17315 (plasmid) [Haloarcula salina]|uniref:hypothetical protein n=1 Tax=Haloarcula salina TaxID=1429914 RepID=UPI003C6EA6BF
MGQLYFPVNFHMWPLEERINWFVTVRDREGLLQEFRNAIGVTAESRSTRLGMAEMGRAVEVVSDGRDVISITQDREGCTSRFRDVMGLRDGTDRLTNDELGKVLVQLYDGEYWRFTPHIESW